MEFLTQLWMPIILSAVFVFIVSSVIHMALPIHKNDMKKLANEEAVLEAMRSNGVEAGAYMFPCAGSMKEMCTPEMVEKLKQGPVGWLTVLPPGGFNINKSLIWWFSYSLIMGVMTAYVGWHGLAAGAPYLEVFQITGAVAFIGYGVGCMSDSIWKGQSWAVTGKFVFDGFCYALVTAGAFGWLWPEAAGV